jgi:TPR repeat protein
LPVIEERLKLARDQPEVWGALVTACRIAGDDARRAAVLEDWLATDLALPWREDLVWLGKFRAEQDGAEAGIKALRTAWRKSRDTEVAAALAELLLASGKTDDYTALVGELSTVDPSQQPANGAEASAVSLARLLRARAALLRGNAEGAFAEYQAYAEHAQYLQPEAASEYLLVVAGLRGAEAAEQSAQELCAKGSMVGSQLTPTQCAANLLTGVGHEQGGLKLLEAAAERAPEDLRLQSSFALAAEQAEKYDAAEQAYRRMLAADPKSEAAWTGLGRITEKRGKPADVEAVVRQAERARGDVPALLELALARSYLAHGRPGRTVEILTGLRKRLPESYIGEEELRQAYAALAAAPAPSPGVAASGAVPAPTPEDLRAVNEAESFLIGAGGQVDEGKARQMIEALARRGNPYANVRVGLWQAFGRVGYTADPRRGAAIAAPSLAAVRTAAEGGEPFAQYLWGTALQNGVGVPKQPAEAEVWLRKAAERNQPWALHNLGWMAESGGTGKPDLQAALAWYRRGAEVGNPASMMSLAVLRLGKEPGVRDPAEGMRWLAQAAKAGLPDAVSWYAAVLLYGREGVPPDPAHARPWLEKAATLGQDRSLYDLGADLLVGAAGPVDEPRSCKFLEEAAAGGNARAMWQLAWQSALGRGTPHDGKRAEEWIQRAAARGIDDPEMLLGSVEDASPAARRYFAEGLRALERLAASGDAYAGGLLARLSANGAGVPEDEARALAFARPAAAGGSTEAMRILGWAYRHGEGVAADPEQAAAWWRRGAEGGNGFCMMWYSQMLFGGEGIVADPAAALAWLERAGERGNAWAVRDLGSLYDEGWHGVPRDETKAVYWKRKALAFDDQEARGWLIVHHLLD